MHLRVERLLAQVGDGDQARALADVHAVGVRDVEEALLEEGGGAVAVGCCFLVVD